MSAGEKRRITTTRHEYVLRSPAAVGEFERLLSWARSEMPEPRRVYDDSMHIEARDDEIVIWWTEEVAG